jgi:hypothetical protein
VERSAALLACAVFVLAGCTSGTDEASTTTSGVPTVTDPGDYSYLANGTPGAHIHDYWKGRTSVTVLDADGGPLTASCDGCDDAMQVFEGRPEEGVIVPQGTGWLNVTVTWSADGDGANRFDGMELLVKTAKDTEPVPVGAITSGAVFRFDSSQEANDPPHYVLSLWRFGVAARPAPGTDEVAFSGSLHVRVEAFRGLPLVPYPPHPDRWQGATELVVARDEMATTEVQTEDPQGGGTGTRCYGGCLGTIAPLNGSVVPVETAEVVVTVTVTEGLPAGLGLRYHGANTWTRTQVNGTHSTPPGSITFRIPVTGTMADSPYARQSLWEFELFIDEPGYVRAWTGAYTFTATAVRG